jgi:outer membrane receptor for ferrienterochelin and colicins
MIRVEQLPPGLASRRPPRPGHAVSAGCLLLALASLSSGPTALAKEAAMPGQPPDFTEISLERLGDVNITSASLHDQRLQDAPASVTVITAEDIRKFGYRTLPDALSWVRGFYSSSDHSYNYIGIRGFNLPGFETRFVLMINGHNIAENIVDSTLAGADFPLDLDLVDRIEVVRGSSSALYGSNGVLATINVVTKRPADSPGISVAVEIDSLGERKTSVSSSIALGRGANLLLSTSIFNDAGAEQLYFPEFDGPATNFGRAIDMDGEKGYQAFADLAWGNWEAVMVTGDHVKTQPVSWGNTVFNDRGTRAQDARGFLELSYTRDLPGDRTLTWRTSYDTYRFRGTYRYVADDGVRDNREHDYGDWIGSNVTYRIPDFSSGYLTLGGNFKIDLRALQNVYDVQPRKNPVLWIDRTDRYAGIFAQQEWSLGRCWEFNLGARFDWSWLKSSSVSPRLALVYRPSPRTDIKAVYGRGFRNPSSYNMFYDDGGLSQIANPSLEPETTDTYEVDLEHAVTRSVRASASVYRYRVNSLIQQIYSATGAIQNVNADRVRAAGASVELSYTLSGMVEIWSSLEMQRAVFDSGAPLTNSPGQIGKLRVSAPLWRDRLTLSAGLQALGQRRTYAGAVLPWVVLPEAVVNAQRLAGGLELSAGIKNLSNTFYREPAGLTRTVDSMIGAGRTYYLKLTWRAAVDSL